jgi:multicomponent Na+:H+ antiporter subunit G
MKSLVIEALLMVVVGAGWLGVAGFARLRTPLDRLHCVTFVNVVCGFSLVAAGFVSDGLSSRAIKILFIVALSLLSGTAMSHATGRSIIQRGKHL